MFRRLILASLMLLPLPALAQPQQQDGSFNLVNRSGQVINEIYASPVTDQNWGQDRLGRNVLANGRNFAVRMRQGAGCRTDIRVVYADSRAEERRDVDTCQNNEVVFGAATAAPGGSGKPGSAQTGATGNPSFNLVNAGSRVVRELYATPTSQTDWGSDLLGSEVVAAGARFAVRLVEGPCNYDIRVVWADGEPEERRNVDLCNVADVTFR